MAKVTKTFQYGQHQVTLETGEIARQAGGAVVVKFGDTVVLVTAVGNKNAREGMDFFPLTVDYIEKFYAGGRIPGGFFKREGRQTERETLVSRLIDRPIRPLFPEHFRNEVQVIATVMSMNPEIHGDIPALIGASAALALSGIPFAGPIGAAKGGYEKEEGANIPGNDITCGMRQWDNSPAPWCRVCGGEAAVKAACDKNPACVAFDMHTSGEFTNCGYLKSAAGPVSQNWGFASFKRTAAKTPTQQQESKPEDHAHSGFQDYQQEEGANIPGNDISCGMRQWDSSAAPWCRVSDGFG